MSPIDFLIGLFLMNAMPHFVLGVWKGRIPSLFGIGPKANMAYSGVCFSISVGLFLWRYGWIGLTENGIYAGALAILVIYYLTGQFWYRSFRVEKEPV